MKAHFEMMAAYNAWANARLYDAAHGLSDEAYRQDLGAAFGSVHGTLNHIFVADMIWMSRFRGEPTPPWALDHIAHDDPTQLGRRRVTLDTDIQGYVLSLSEEDVAGEMTYRPVTMPDEVTQPRAAALAHFFNHQTHHRGQCHALITRLGATVPPLDLLYFQRNL